MPHVLLQFPQAFLPVLPDPVNAKAVPECVGVQVVSCAAVEVKDKRYVSINPSLFDYLPDPVPGDGKDLASPPYADIAPELG